MSALGSLRFLAALSALATITSCFGADVDAGSPVSLGAQDPAIFTQAATLIFSFSTQKTCKDLIDLGPVELDALLQPERAPLQLLEPAAGDDHVFGKVPPGVPIAYFVLASSRINTNQHVELAQFKGSVFAMGCRDFSAPSGTRQDLPLTLFPIGLR